MTNKFFAVNDWYILSGRISERVSVNRRETVKEGVETTHLNLMCVRIFYYPFSLINSNIKSALSLIDTFGILTISYP